MAWTCAFCGTENPDGADICLVCSNERQVESPSGAGQPSGPGSVSQCQSQPRFQSQPYKPEALEPVWDCPPLASCQSPSSGAHEAPQPASRPSPCAGQVLSPSSPMPSPSIQEGASDVPTRLFLEMLSTGAVIEIGPHGGFVGREGDFGSDVLADCTHISRTHVLFKPYGTGWSAMHAGSNPSVLFTPNGSINLGRDFDSPIHDGDTLRMADISFRIHIQPLDAAANSSSSKRVVPGDGEQASDAPAQATCAGSSFDEGLTACSNVDPSSVEACSGGSESDASDLVEGWFIDCPPGGCGHSFLVEGESSRLASCPCCVDIMDKRRIARVRPVWGVRRKGEFDDARG